MSRSKARWWIKEHEGGLASDRRSYGMRIRISWNQITDVNQVWHAYMLNPRYDLNLFEQESSETSLIFSLCSSWYAEDCMRISACNILKGFEGHFGALLVSYLFFFSIPHLSNPFSSFSRKIQRRHYWRKLQPKPARTSGSHERRSRLTHSREWRPWRAKSFSVPNAMAQYASVSTCPSSTTEVFLN